MKATEQDASCVRCELVSAEGSLFSGQVTYLAVTGSEGDLGIHVGHAPLVTAIKPGPVRVHCQDGEEKIFYVSGGFLEVQPDCVTVLADTALRAGDMDEAAVEKARQEAEKALQGKKGEFDYARAATQLAEVTAQLRTIKAIRSKAGLK
ncbi:MAG: F0F1 ATP synthase subunit epsilon [Kistimonas sp.]|nr:F0F1 ATP synthase subunit epsilon [Kistimonas sp.]